MRRTEGRVGGLVAVALLVGAPSGPQAHSLAVERGDVEVRADRAIVRLAVPVQALVTSGPGSGRLAMAEAARDHEADLLDGLAIRVTSGERLAGRIVETVLPDAPASGPQEWPTGVVTYAIEYRLSEPPTYLSFQRRPGHGGGRGRPLRLIVRSAGLDRPRVAHLTTGGNVETLGFVWGDAAPSTIEQVACGATADAGRFHDVEVRVDVGDHEVVVDTIVPLPVLETWLHLPRTDADFLDVAEQHAAAQTLESFFAHGDEVRIDGRVHRPRVEPARFLAPDDRVEAPSNAGRIGAWTARVATRRRYRTGERIESVTLDWQRFNAAVLTAEVYLDVAGRCTHRQVSTYASILEWSLDSSVSRAPRPADPVRVRAGR